MKQVNFKVVASRRFPDPLSKTLKCNLERHSFLIKVADLSPQIPSANLRATNISRRVYREVAESLMSPDPSFHIKNKGMTVIAEEAIISDDRDEVTLRFSDIAVDQEERQGILDGNHTYEIIKENRDACVVEQYVRMDVYTGVPSEMIPAIAAGLNTTVQVQAMTLENYKREFDWIEEELKSTPYHDKIAYRENEDKEYDVRDIISFLTLFNIHLYPQNETAHPIVAYSSKAQCLTQFSDKKYKQSYIKLRPLLRDILTLHDTIHMESLDRYNKDFKGRGGALAFVQTRERGAFKFTFLNKDGKNKLFDGALYPMLGAFRFLVKESPDGTQYQWKPTNGFNGVLELFRKIAGEMINSTKDVSDGNKRNPNAIGKDKTHWGNLYKTVGMNFLLEGSN